MRASEKKKEVTMRFGKIVFFSSTRAYLYFYRKILLLQRELIFKAGAGKKSYPLCFLEFKFFFFYSKRARAPGEKEQKSTGIMN